MPDRFTERTNRAGKGSSRWSSRCLVAGFLIVVLAVGGCSGWPGIGRWTSEDPGGAPPLDSDADGIPDSTDNCPQIANRDQRDLDGNGWGDRCDDRDGDGRDDATDEWPLDPDNDIDGDGVGADPYGNCAYICDRCERLSELCRQVDNCPYLANDQVDTDGDGRGDRCDNAIGAEPPTCHSVHNPCDEPPLDDASAEKDRDKDGVPDSEDNCPKKANPYDVDTDGDGIFDAQLNTDNDAEGDPCDADDDDDGYPDLDDNCPLVHNALQVDLDCDGEGDACDDDRDGDGLSDAVEMMDLGTSPTLADSDGDGTSDGHLVPQCPNTNLEPGPDETPLGEVKPTIAFLIRDVSGADITKRWIPGLHPDSTNWWDQRSQVEVIARLVDPVDPSAEFTQGVTFTIDHTPIDGTATNEIDDVGNDFSFDPGRSTLTATVQMTGAEAMISLYAFDYGGHLTLRARTTYQSAPLEAMIELPLDADHDGLPDAWEKAHTGFKPDNPHTFSGDYLDGAADVDTSLDNSHNGDGLTNFEEYRGIVFDPTNAGKYHKRLNPLRKDLFVRGDFFSNSLDPPLPSVSGPVQPFSVDYAAIYGKPAGTPGAFEEAGIDVHDVTGMASFSQATEPPNIDILVVKNITESDPIPTLFGQKDGIIDHPSIDQPRYWSWDLKGASYIGDATDYAPLRTPSTTLHFTEIYHLCLMHYFFNRPYMEDTDNASLCNRGYTAKLDALGNVEDYYKENGTDPPDKHGNNDEERCIVANDRQLARLDGDRMVPTWMSQTYANNAEEYELGLSYSVFDADADGRVENPIVSDPGALDSNQLDPGEYTLKQVQLHTILHEMGHAVGMNKYHTSDPDCLMYEDSINWDRAGHFSPAARQEIFIHNN